MQIFKNSFLFVAMGVIGLAGTDLKAQQTSTEKARAYITRMQQVYKDASYLGLQLKYLYTNAGSVAPMDSLSGSMQLDKGRCRISISGTETVMTDKYVIHLVEEDKLIYLSSARGGIPMDPMQVLDTVIRQMKDVQVSLSADGGTKTMELRFPPGGNYSYIRMVSDATTGYFQRMSYGVHTAGFVGQEQINGAGHGGLYEPEGRIDVLFSNYEKGKFGDELFDERKFFNHVAGRYEPAGRYKDYHIFLASSNL